MSVSRLMATLRHIFTKAAEWDMMEIRKKQGLTTKVIFTYYAKIIQRVERAFKEALRRAGIENFKFRDLRHTFANYLVMRGGKSEKDSRVIRS